MAAAVALPVMAAAPASATQGACANYVRSHGYLVGPKVKAACSHGALFSGVIKVPNAACILGLTRAGVNKGEVVQNACMRA
ncbi:hypothetical protein ABT133_00775 [Streptomyces sp. NPDC001835]|uniref:hypothetical protein n=1 Tax=unclassified Streptomyces TaxID=2593676 RepID=UPI0033286EA9